LALADAKQQHADIQWVAMLHAQREREAVVVNVLRHYDARSALVFCHTRETVHRIHATLSERGFSAVVLSGDLGQAERSRALAAVRDGRARVLVATNVAARGIDLPSLDLVIHADLPGDVESFTHRSGRTGRAGALGEAISLFAPSEEKYLLDIEKLIKTSIVRGTLDIPGELLSRGAAREEPRTGRSSFGSERSHSGSTSERSQASRGTSGDRAERGARPSRYSAPAKPIDDFFTKPYQPSAASLAAAAHAPDTAVKKHSLLTKRPVGLLLGATQKKPD
jgi:superfamily II DNA/RNA helicase